MIRSELINAWLRPRTLAMLGLGFASGLPFLLTANTFGYWLREAGASLSAIGFLSWVGLAYSLKMLWAPLIDRLPPPFFAALGRRRGWILLAQIATAAGLAAMAYLGPESGLTTIGLAALCVAFASATQDIVIDAWRIEAAGDPEEIGLLTSASQLGYRAALLITDALILIVAAHLGWPIAYGLCAGLMAIGMIAVGFAREPKDADAAMDRLRPIWTARGALDSLTGPFLAFFKTYGWISLLILGLISLYQVPNFVMGPMYNPLYHDIGLSKEQVGAIRGSVGLGFSLLGIVTGGVSALRLGQMKTLAIGAAAQGLSIASIAILCWSRDDLVIFSLIMAFDSFGVSFAGVALVTYMSGLTNIGYTATQYALLSSTYAYLGKFLKGFSGMIVESLARDHGLIAAYGIFFVSAGAMALPALMLCSILALKER